MMPRTSQSRTSVPRSEDRGGKQHEEVVKQQQTQQGAIDRDTSCRSYRGARQDDKPRLQSILFCQRGAGT